MTGPDETKELLRDIARARNVLDALEAEAIHRLDSMGWYLDDAAVSAKAWLAYRTGIPRAVAGARVRLAKRLRRLPLLAEAMAVGAVTIHHARSMARCITPRTLCELARDEELIVAQAMKMEADDFDRYISGWLRINDPDGAEPGGGEPSTLTAAKHYGGRVHVSGDLDVEDGAVFLAELDALYEHLWQEDQAADESDPNKGRTPAQRNAAALREMAERSSAADTGGGHARPRSTSIMVIADLAAVEGDRGGAAALEDGTLLPRSVLDRWLCDTAVSRVLTRGSSRILDLGRTTRVPSAPQRRALIARDRHCIVPGCDRKPRWCEAHHVHWWTRGGPTDLSNLVLLCHRHHKMVHLEQITIEPAGDGYWRVLRPDGTDVARPPPRARAA